MKRGMIMLMLLLLCLCGCSERVPEADLERPVKAVYAEADSPAAHTAIWEDCEYTCYILFTAADNLTDVRLSMLDIMDAPTIRLGEVFYSAAEMEYGETLLAGVVYYGDLTTYAITFVDSSGAERTFSCFMSGKDGSLIFEEKECVELSDE